MNYLWSTLEKVSNILIQFIFTIYISRLITPGDYAIIGALAIFNSISLILIDSGFSHSIIREKHISSIELNSIFLLNVFLGVSIFIVLYFFLPLIQSYFNISNLEKSGQIYFLSIPILSLGVVPFGILQREMMFKKIFIISFFSSLLSVIIAYSIKSYVLSYWVLIIQFLIQSTIRTILFLYFSRISINLNFSLKDIKRFFPFSKDILISGISASVFDNLHGLVIGKNFSKEEFGYFSQAKRINLVSLTLVTTSFITVIYSKLSKIKDTDGLKSIYYSELSTLLFINSLFIGSLFINSNSLIELLLGEKWLGSVPYFKILSLTAVLYPIHMISINLLKVIGKSRIYLFLEILNKVLLITSVFLVIRFNSIVIVQSYLFYYLVIIFIDVYVLAKAFEIKIEKQIKIIMLNLILFFLALFVTYKFQNFNFNLFYSIIANSIFFIVLFSILNYIFNKNLFKGFLSELKSTKL